MKTKRTKNNACTRAVWTDVRLMLLKYQLWIYKFAWICCPFTSTTEEYERFRTRFEIIVVVCPTVLAVGVRHFEWYHTSHCRHWRRYYRTNVSDKIVRTFTVWKHLWNPNSSKFEKFDCDVCGNGRYSYTYKHIIYRRITCYP